MSEQDVIDQAVRRARRFAALGHDEAAKTAYLYVLRLDPANLAALNELGVLALASGHRSAARTAWAQAVQHHPDDAQVRVNLGNLLAEDGDEASARAQFDSVLAVNPVHPQAHQGLARLLAAIGDPTAEVHWQQGFSGHAVVARPYRGMGTGEAVLLLVSARGGNVATQRWVNDRRFAVSAIYAEFFDPTEPLPPHDLVVNAIGDADLCHEALDRAEAMVARSSSPIINQPARVRRTGRAEMAHRMRHVSGVITPRIVTISRAVPPAAAGLRFPLLLRAPGFHTGQHFHFVPTADGWSDTVATLPGKTVLALEYLDARGPDGMARKYRVMCIDGRLYPLHLAISTDWKVHYFTAEMATNAAFREEERRFLEDMPTVLGERAMVALAAIAATLGLDYAGIDFALAPDGSVLLFEANATMAMPSPDPDPIWDYRRTAFASAFHAVDRMVSERLSGRI
jgi:hypothetical protein